MCFIWCWLFAFFVRIILISLFPKSSISRTISNFNLLIKCQIHNIFLAAYLSAIYSALIVDINTILCFLLLYKITALLKKKQYPIIDFWSSKLLIRLLFTYLMSLYKDRSLGDALSDLLLYTNLSYIVLFKYWIILIIVRRWLFFKSKLYLLSCHITKAMSDLVLHAKYISLSIKNWKDKVLVFHSCQTYLSWWKTRFLLE